MKLWRITTRKWALDKRCDGARQYGGRWNPISYPAMYAGATIEICALEKFVHLDGAPPPPLVLVSIEVPDDKKLFVQPSLATLPKDWSDLPAPAGAQEFGRQWLASASQLVMFLPSAIIPEATNAVINPRHDRYAEVVLTIEREFTFDARMFKTK
ncbi:RES family NAD+ phosphorylase [Collimonas sp.]|jgi:RES domain-containing protein|uniref:RES family NAD+ phosphorylase n=1 Tax=Collimonas sp. TaxID=1963772 RepID=UPI002C55FAE9|nr:RES family NAD+ phosphorylase [Collimonas sp.]HWW08486.1 RES family NAD+ phosphorylase [Collimonas sp.]